MFADTIAAKIEARLDRALFFKDFIQACCEIGRKDEDIRAGRGDVGLPETEYGNLTRQMVVAMLQVRHNRYMMGLRPESPRDMRYARSNIRRLDLARHELLVAEGLDQISLREWRRHHHQLCNEAADARGKM